MSRSGLARFIRLGQQADPSILDAIKRGAPPEFRPALSYHFEVPGKRMRAAMVVLSCGAAGGKVERTVKPAAVVEMIHNYSLVMDDLIDRGEVRRGRPTVRVVMGDSIALLVAMFYRELLDDLIENSPASVEIRKTAVKTMKEIIDGERLDLLLEQAGRTDPYLIKNRIS
ncbi:MAG TPA: polyprenyl synthetase family protein, partial [Candidatus Bathyarchaeia archaeon]|nr:polyprenyl synthetase family protein [Candidatus Bathyarchaeia archaeon]